MIQNVWIGGQSYFSTTYNKQMTENPYPQVNAILEKLGFVSGNGLHHRNLINHHNHFHVDLRAPDRLDLPDNLEVEETVQDVPTIINIKEWESELQKLIENVGEALNLKLGDVDMFVGDLPPDISLLDQPVMIAQADQMAASDSDRERAIGVCFPAPNDNYSAENAISPKRSAAQYLRTYDDLKVAYKESGVVTILEQPKCGMLHLITESDGDRYGSGRFDPNDFRYAYLPEKGYLGDDKAVFLVEMAGVKVKVVYFFQAVEGPLGSYGFEEYCAESGYTWKISSTINSDGNVVLTSVDYLDPPLEQTQDINVDGLEAWVESLDLGSYLTDGLDITLSSLKSGALGESTNKTITLDNNANGYGWYVDLTPGLNEEFLPTANPGK